MHIFLRMPKAIHTASKASICLLEWGGEKEALTESRQTFEVTPSQTSRLVNLIPSRQTVFFEYEDPFIDRVMIITETAVANMHAAIRPGLETIS